MLRRRPSIAKTVIGTPTDHTTMSADGAVRSVQAADLVLPAPELDGIWTPAHLERLARTYWRFLARVTLFAVGVRYSERERTVVALGVIPLLTFQAPEYEMDERRGMIRWRIDRGLLVSKAGRGGRGHLQIDLHRTAPDRLHVEVEVENFYPSIAAGIGRRVYEQTQSRAHVFVTHGFLRSIARLDLAESRVGRFAARD